MPAANVYFIWYGNWNGNTGVNILPQFISDLSGSSYSQIYSTYNDSFGNIVSPNISMLNQTFDSYSQGSSLPAGGVPAVVNRAISLGQLPADSNGIYFVLGSSDVHESSSHGTYCQDYCGYHEHASISGVDIKYAFVGNPIDQCFTTAPRCSANNLTSSPNDNPGADEMATTVAHELSEALTDPDSNAWGDFGANEIGDKCNFQFGDEKFFSHLPNGSVSNFGVNGRNYLIQQEWINLGGGSCPMSYIGNSNLAPAIATFNGRLYMAWIGTDANHRINLMSSTDGLNFNNHVVLADNSNHAPALVAFNGALYLAWTGTDSRQTLTIMSSADGINFGNKVALGNSSIQGPALATLNGLLYIAWTGTDSNHSLNVMSSANGVNFGNQVSFRDNSTQGPALTAFNGSLYLAWTGTDRNHSLNIMSSANGINFGNKAAFADNSNNSPALAALNGVLHLSWTGTDASGTINDMSSTNGINFGSKVAFSQFSIAGPSTSTFNNSLSFSWTGTDSNHSLNARPSSTM